MNVQLRVITIYETLTLWYVSCVCDIKYYLELCTCTFVIKSLLTEQERCPGDTDGPDIAQVASSGLLLQKTKTLGRYGL